jgi:Fe-S oxidoreductase
MTRQLPLLADSQAALETCGYCPKLCRGACPVSDAEPRESLTPWGKMTMAWLAQRGDVPADRENSRVTWACSGCHACQSWCEHSNPVFETLLKARADASAVGAAPESVKQALAKQAHRARLNRERVDQLARELALPQRSKQVLLVGCAYWLEFPDVARNLVLAVRKLIGDFTLIDECCGAVRAYAGDRLGRDVAAARMAKKLSGVERVIVHDPGCAMHLASYSVETVVALADRERAALGTLAAATTARPMRWHDPCQLGRGLGLFDEPRRVLTKLLGRAPDEFRASREQALCSGGGGLLPVTYPEISGRMAERRLAEHESSGGGTVVTACATSLRRFRRSGAEAIDLASLLFDGVDDS